MISFSPPVVYLACPVISCSLPAGFVGREADFEGAAFVEGAVFVIVSTEPVIGADVLEVALEEPWEEPVPIVVFELTRPFTLELPVVPILPVAEELPIEPPDVAAELPEELPPELPPPAPPPPPPPPPPPCANAKVEPRARTDASATVTSFMLSSPEG
jgi:hypothetical protein